MVKKTLKSKITWIKLFLQLKILIILVKDKIGKTI